MLTTALSQRDLIVTFKLVKGGFGSGGGDTLTLTGLRVSAHIDIVGGITAAQAMIRIEGMRQTDMNRLSVVQMPGDLYQVNANTVTVQATDGSSSTPILVFTGNVQGAYVDFTGAPEVAFVVNAVSSGVDVQSGPVTSFPGGVQASVVLSSIANAAGLGFNNNGVTAVLQDPYFWGSPGDQIVQACRALRCTYLVHKGVLEIWPQQPPVKKSVPMVSADTGLIGYPAYNAAGVEFTCLFNPALTWWGPVQLKSAYLPAGWVNFYGDRQGQAASDGQYVVIRLAHELASQTPDGPWFTHVVGAAPEVAANTVGE